MTCRSCNSPITPFFSMDKMPLVNSFLKKEELSFEKKYDLTVAFCSRCYLVQLTKTVPPDELFSNYLYFSSVSSSFLDYCKKSAEYLIMRLGLGKESLVLEIASNDGAMLKFFKTASIGILGIDPAKNIAAAANSKGIPTLPEFFNLKLAQKLKKETGVVADLVYGANVLAHVPGINDFVAGVKTILKPKGSAVFEFPYIAGLFENKFDTIYHEHVFYYSLIALRNLFKRAGLELYDVEQIPVQGGSLRIFVSYPGVFLVSDAVKSMAEREVSAGFDKIETYQKVGKSISKLREKLISTLDELRRTGKRVAAYSAPAKGNILLNYFGLKNYLDFVVDKAPAKQGLYAPGTHFMVHPIEEVYKQKPDYLLVLCWNIVDEVANMPELQEFRRAGGKFIVPIPEVRTI